LVTTRNVPKLIGEMRSVLAQYPGTSFEIDSFLTERINETLTGYVADYIVNVYGSNLDELDALAAQIVDGLKTIHGATDILIQTPPGAPQMNVDLNGQALARWGLNRTEVLNTISAAYQGKTVGQIYENGRTFDVVLILDPKDRDRPDKLHQLLLRNPDGDYLELGQVASIAATSGRYNIAHDGGRRVMTVTCNLSGVSVTTFDKEVKAQILEKLHLPAGFYVETEGVAAAEKSAMDQLLVHAIMIAAIIVVILYMILKSIPYLLLILCNLPFALVGGILAVVLTGGVLSIGALIGFVTVFGITLRNSIMIVLHTQHLVRYENKLWGRETIMQAAQERLAPILMTALATILALLPIALINGRPGTEIEGPVAIVILGGLITSTLLNLLVLPLLMMRFPRRFEVKEEEAK
jgi:Cu/Ag efflux pump CusA